MDFVLLGWVATVILWAGLEAWRFLDVGSEEELVVESKPDVNLNGGVVHVDFASPPDWVPYTSTVILRLDGMELYRTFIEPKEVWEYIEKLKESPNAQVS